jgi:hypothetical protein
LLLGGEINAEIEKAASEGTESRAAPRPRVA